MVDVKNISRDPIQNTVAADCQSGGFCIASRRIASRLDLEIRIRGWRSGWCDSGRGLRDVFSFFLSFFLS